MTMGASTRPPPGRFRPLALGQGRALLVRPCWRLGANSLRVGPHDLEGGVGRPGLGGMLRGCGSKNAFAKIRRPHCCPAWSWAGASGCRPPHQSLLCGGRKTQTVGLCGGWSAGSPGLHGSVTQAVGTLAGAQATTTRSIRMPFMFKAAQASQFLS